MTSAERHARAQLADVRPSPFWQPSLVLLAETGCTVRKWRSELSGVAYTHDADWGIAAPPPTTALRFSIFAHEVGHQALHRSSSQPRWVEEVQAWDFALEQFDRFELDGRADAEGRARRSLTYRFKNLLRRGVTPAAMLAFPDSAVQWWAQDLDVRQLAEDLLHEGGA